MIVHLTAEAESDLEQIGDYMAQDNPKRALSFVLELRDKCLSLAETPWGFLYLIGDDLSPAISAMTTMRFPVHLPG